VAKHRRSCSAASSAHKRGRTVYPHAAQTRQEVENAFSSAQVAPISSVRRGPRHSIEEQAPPQQEEEGANLGDIQC
jgi:hypothetical protein